MRIADGLPFQRQSLGRDIRLQRGDAERRFRRGVDLRFPARSGLHCAAHTGARLNASSPTASAIAFITDP